MKKLIELDAAINATWKDTGYTDSLNVMTAIRDRLEALPTVDAVPVKHGRWMLGVSLWYCSECGSSYSYNDYAYCPHCGAKMCGKEDGDGNG